MANLTTSIMTSNLPVKAKSQLARWVETVGGTPDALARSVEGIGGFSAALRQGGESIVVGGALGAIHGMSANGLDGLNDVPADAVLGAASLATSIFAPATVSPELRNAGAAAITVFAFRKTAAFVAEKRASAAMSGECDMEGEDDALIEAAKGL